MGPLSLRTYSYSVAYWTESGMLLKDLTIGLTVAKL